MWQVVAFFGIAVVTIVAILAVLTLILRPRKVHPLSRYEGEEHAWEAKRIAGQSRALQMVSRCTCGARTSTGCVCDSRG
jgi:hypothetical protein